MSGEYLNVSAKADVTIGYGLVQSQGSPLNVRSGPGTSYGKVTSLNNGAVVNIVGIDNGWYKISTNGVTGYVSSDYMVTCSDSAGSRGDGATAVATASQQPAEPSGWWTARHSTSVCPCVRWRQRPQQL